MLKNIKNNTKGFTIIEVLIVLAIAGLILLVVFLAVPSLQRNSRNTQRKNDISSILGGISEAISNGNGQLPIDDADFNTRVANGVNFGFYDNSVAANVTYTKNAAATAPPGPAAGALDIVHIHTFSKCNATFTGAQAAGATSRSVVALYRVEQGGNNNGQLLCQET